MTENVYIIDTSSLIDLNRNTPKDVFPSIWQEMEDLIYSNRLFAPREVLNEIGESDDDLHEWAKKHRKMFVEITEGQLEIVRKIMDEFPSLVTSENKKYSADPWVIALAMEMSRQATLTADKRIVVTNEKLKENKVRIPFVCKHFSIESIDLLGMSRLEGWQF